MNNLVGTEGGTDHKVNELQTTYEPTYNGFRIYTNRQKGQGAYVKILDGIHRQLINIQSHHSRIQVIRFEIRLPSKKIYNVKEENKEIRAFFKSVKENMALNRWGARKKVAHGWVREEGKTKHGHYHVFMAFERLTVTLGRFSGQGYSGLWELLRSLSKRITGASLRFCPVYHTLERGDINAYDKCFYHLSYLAKLKDKEFGTGSRYKGFDFSRIQHKPNSKTPI